MTFLRCAVDFVLHLFVGCEFEFQRFARVGYPRLVKLVENTIEFSSSLRSVVLLFSSLLVAAAVVSTLVYLSSDDHYPNVALLFVNSTQQQNA